MLITFRDNLRKNMTNAEKILWIHLRNRHLSGLKFRRQFIMPPYIVDFVCLKKRLVIELDGSHHVDNVEYDKQRTLFLKENNFNVIRFWNREVIDNISWVIEVIIKELKRK